MSTTKAYLDYLLKEARTLQDKYYQEWVKIDREESEKDEHKPSEAHENARQLCLTTHKFFSSLECAAYYFKEYKKLAKQ